MAEPRCVIPLSFEGYGDVEVRNLAGLSRADLDRLCRTLGGELQDALTLDDVGTAAERVAGKYGVRVAALDPPSDPARPSVVVTLLPK